MGLAQLREHLQAIHARQQDVHQHHIKVFISGAVQAFLAVLAPHHLKPAAHQLLMQIGAQNGVVFNGQKARGLNGYGIH